MSTNLPPTAYVKMIDCWLIFSLLKPFTDILVQTFIQTLREESQQKVNRTEKTLAWAGGKTNKDWKIKFCTKFLKTLYPVFFTAFVVMFWLVGLVHYHIN